MKVLLLTSARQLTAAAVAAALDQLGVDPTTTSATTTSATANATTATPTTPTTTDDRIDVAVLATQPPTEPSAVRVLAVPPLLAGVGAVGGRGRSVLLTLAWSTSSVARRAFREATVVVALDSGTHQAAWLLAQRYRRPAVVAGAAAGRRIIAERDRSAR